MKKDAEDNQEGAAEDFPQVLSLDEHSKLDVELAEPFLILCQSTINACASDNEFVDQDIVEMDFDQLDENSRSSEISEADASEQHRNVFDGYTSLPELVDSIDIDEPCKGYFEDEQMDSQHPNAIYISDSDDDKDIEVASENTNDIEIERETNYSTVHVPRGVLMIAIQKQKSLN